MNLGADERCLHELFEEQAQRTPDAPAVADERGDLSYRELDRQADLLASRLRGEGVGRDEIVGVYLERRNEFVVACLAALKAGGAFLPIELAYPPALIGDVLEDAEPRVVLTQRDLAGQLPEGRGIVCLDEGWEDALDGEAAQVEEEHRPRPDDLAFVSYSSGTTGKPKGIANPHRAAVGSYLWRFGIRDYEPGDRVACGVFFIWEVFRPLLRGATSCIVPDDVIYDPSALLRYLGDEGITDILVTPSLLETLLDAGGPDLAERTKDLKTLWLNGEVVTKKLARRALAALPRVRLLNVYSVSETHEVGAGDLRELVESAGSTHCPIGRPNDPDRLYVLDEDGSPVPAGTAGELYVGGGLLARGYVKLPEKTAERFLPDPHAGEEGARMYRTGDKARLLPDGNLEILGRMDFMVKIRGYSIELGAVEAALLEHLAIDGCVVVAEGEEGEDKRLVAYLVPGQKRDWSVDRRTGRSPQIRRVLQESLPHYMIPTVYVELDQLPVQETTGKVDRAELPVPPRRTSSDDLAVKRLELPADASRAEQETLLARLWEHVLGLEEGDVRRDDDFFDVGGHSLAAAQLLGHVEEVFDVQLSMPEFLAHDTTVEGLLGAIEARRAGGDRDGVEGSLPTVDLHEEAVLEEEIRPGEEADPATLAEARSIFLTGATGFLGAFLLDELLSSTEAEIRCLVRPRKGEDALMAPLRANLERYGLWDRGYAGRIVPVGGDLGEPMFGMSEEDFERLAQEVDVIFHAGAMVNLIYPYQPLAPANVGGTREVLRLACRGGATPVHHVSTNGIFPSGTGECREDADLDALADGLDNGYGQSKWVAERLVREARARGLPVTVYRPGNVSGHSQTGAANPRDALGAVIAESLRIESAPEIDGWRIEMTPVDFVASAIRHLAEDPANTGKTFHLANPNPVPAEETFSWIEDLGYRLERVSYPEWLATLGDSPREDPDTDSFVGIPAGAEPDERELWDGNRYDDANTRRALADGGPKRPSLDAELFETYVRYFVQLGWAGDAGLPRGVRAGARS
jgi:amino acid adenylation domain-containing protein/thioester reductase-like protein